MNLQGVCASTQVQQVDLDIIMRNIDLIRRNVGRRVRFESDR